VVNLVHGDERLCRQSKIALTIDCDRATFTRFVVELDVPRLHLLDEGLRLGSQALGLLEIGRTLDLERLALMIDESFLGVTLCASLWQVALSGREQTGAGSRRGVS
jgi:hypothetical protein